MSDETPSRREQMPMAVTPEGGPAVPYVRADGKQLLSATWGLLRQDKELIVLPLIGSVFGLLAAVILFFPGYGLGWVAGGRHESDLAYWVGGALAAFGSTVVGVFFQAALVIGANQRADGGDPTMRSCLRGAWRRKWQILTWSVLATVVGLVLQQIQERLGFLGSVIKIFGSVAWGVATFVVVPVLVVEDVGTIGAIKRSAQILRDTWGTSLRTAVRGGVLAAVLWIVPTIVLAVGIGLAFVGDDGALVVGILLAAVGGVALVVAATLIGAVGAYARALIYRYAVGLPTPGVPDRVLAGAFRPKKQGTDKLSW